jgi:hypothetical protein
MFWCCLYVGCTVCIHVVVLVVVVFGVGHVDASINPKVHAAMISAI